MMQRIWMVAARDFTATVSGKGFLVGLLIMPVLIVLFIVLGPRILNSRSPDIVGQVAVVDSTGSVSSELRAALAPTAIAARRAQARESGTAVGEQPGNLAIPSISVIERTPAEPLQKDKDWLIQAAEARERHLALVIVRPDAVVRGTGKSEYGSYDLYISSRLDEVTEYVITEGMRQALVSARLKVDGIDPAAVQASMKVVRPTSVTVGANGERQTQRGVARLLPIICGVLIFIGAITGGQILMTSTVEEKSSRIVEVLLAAVSPVELMWGKLLGQLGVGLLILAVYVGLGILALVQYSMLGMIDPMLILYLLVFYFLAYLVYGALMLAIGAAVNQIADAQSLMGPVMVLLVAPYALVPLIGRAPNSTLSVAFSFIPPINSFAMLARLASGTPPPLWQVFGSLVAGFAGACVAVWFAAKVFKIGLLMHGKPPNFATLVRWARMA
jgi:ABC-2 type transport system permease protein